LLIMISVRTADYEVASQQAMSTRCKVDFRYNGHFIF
jgi:hypothetical protein